MEAFDQAIPESFLRPTPCHRTQHETHVSKSLRKCVLTIQEVVDGFENTWDGLVGTLPKLGPFFLDVFYTVLQQRRPYRV